MLDDFHGDNINIARLNYDIITLVPKSKEAKQIRRLICLLNVSYKISTKIIMNKLSEVVGSSISPIQTAFTKDMYIMKGVIILHEATDTMHVKKTECYSFQS